MVLAVYVGFSRLHHLRFLGREPMLTGILRVWRLPPQCTFWRFLASLHVGIARQLLEVRRRMRERVWEAAHVKLAAVTLDTDTTVHTLFGDQMGGRRSYNPKNKGKKSYQPILTFLAETREYVSGELRNGDRPMDDRDRRLVNSHRGEHSCLGFVIQLCTARFLGTFLEDLSDVPSGVINCLARQLQIEQLSCFFHYRDSETRWDHAAEIRRHCGFRDFGDPGAQFSLNRWLYALCWTGTDRPGVLFDRATTWLIAQKVLLPAVTTLERHVARLRSRVEERVWSMLAAAASPETRAKLETLLSIPESGHQSLLDRLRKGPYRRSAPELVRALDRVEEVRRLGITLSIAHRIPTGRLHALARFASTAKISVIRRLPESRRLATLVAFASNLEAVALDDALDGVDPTVVL